MKRFEDWIQLKERLHQKNFSPPLVSEREIWWVSFGENVGSEINGKSALFSRPAIILKKLSHGFYLIAPTTTQIRVGTWYVPFKQGGKEMNACLNQIRTIDYRRLFSRLGKLDDFDYGRIKSGFKKIYF